MLRFPGGSQSSASFELATGCLDTAAAAAAHPLFPRPISHRFYLVDEKRDLVLTLPPP
jgi:hypothetical protein